MKNLSKLILVFASVFLGINTSQAQIPSKKDKASRAAEIKSLIDKKDFVFKASKKSQSPNMQPYVAVSHDTLVVNLAGQTSSESVKFNGTHFGYQAAQNRKGDWDITIKPSTSMSDVKELTLAVMPTGHTSLHVIRSHGSPLSFVGYIKQEDY